MVGAVELSLSDTAGQEAVVGSVQRAVVARVRNTWRSRTAMSRAHRLRQWDLELEGNARSSSRVYSRKLHQALRRHRPIPMEISTRWLAFQLKREIGVHMRLRKDIIP